MLFYIKNIHILPLIDNTIHESYTKHKLQVKDIAELLKTQIVYQINVVFQSYLSIKHAVSAAIAAS